MVVVMVGIIVIARVRVIIIDNKMIKPPLVKITITSRRSESSRPSPRPVFHCNNNNNDNNNDNNNNNNRHNGDHRLFGTRRGPSQ